MATVAEITHLLARTEFVARPQRVSALTPLSYAKAVDAVLGTDESPVPIPAGLDQQSDSGNYQQWVQAVHWWFERMTRTAAQPFRERMAFFWHGHFCSDWGKVYDTGAMMQQNALFRDHGLGNVRTLAKRMAKQPAMLEYLDNATNRRQSPNQNFARELLELFLLGVGNYTEADVEAAARAWTGHTIDRPTRQYVFRADWHDTGSKTFLGRTGAWGGDDIIDIVLGSQARVAVGPNAGLPTRVVAARFLTRKLWESFVHQGPPAAAVNAVADALVAADFSIRPWVRALLLRPEFQSSTARQGLVRTPTEYVVSLLYHTGLGASAVNPQWWTGRMGQELFRPPNVSGWRPNGYWINAGAMAARAEFASHVRWRLCNGRGDGQPLVLRSRSHAWSSLDAMSPAKLVDTLAADFGVSLAPSTRSTLIAWADGERRPWGPDWWRSTNALLLTMVVPEMSLAG